MGKLAFVFSGQGAQYAGMGRDLFENNPSARGIFRLADEIRPGTSEQCFHATDAELAGTRITQPCLFVMELAAAAAAAGAGLRPTAAAGFSLGEMSALTFSGAVGFETGFRLTCLRGELMQADAEKQDSGMLAVLKLPAEKVEELCARYGHIYPVNYNCPGQTAVSGLASELNGFIGDVKAAGGRAVPLRVAGGFHSPFMAEAAGKFEKALKSNKYHTPSITLYSDYTGLPYGGDFIALLSRQICNPVKWGDIITNMIKSGIDTFVEIGPGRTLCGLIGKTDGSVRTCNIEDCESLKKAVEGVPAC